MKPFGAWLALAACILALGASAAPAPRTPMRKWDDKHRLAEGAFVGPFTVIATRRIDAKDSDGGQIVLATFVDNQGKRFNLTADVAFEDVYASLGAARLDPASSKPQLLLTTYTGGAHCCVHIQLADWIDGRWTTVDVGTFDGEPFDYVPVADGPQGVADLVHYDDRFAYAFCAYACSWMPPRIFNVRAGKVQDVSAAPHYRPLFQADYDKARKSCEEDGGAGACAGMVADGARLGHYKEALAFALAHVQTEADWSYPGCKVTVAAKAQCPKDQMYIGEDFEVALTKYLARIGYIPG